MAVSVGPKVLIDTNILIDYLRAGLHAEWILGGVGQINRFLSAIVLLELQLGANTKKRQRAIERLQKAFPQSRILSPTSDLYADAGRVFRSVYGDGSGLKDRLAPIHDVLIALTARKIGATVVTRNIMEFRRIGRKVRGLKIVAPD